MDLKWLMTIRNPQDFALNLLRMQMGNTPMGQNLITLAQQGDAVQIEAIARNIVAQRGLDYDKEFNTFKSMLGVK